MLYRQKNNPWIQDRINTIFSPLCINAKRRNPQWCYLSFSQKEIVDMKKRILGTLLATASLLAFSPLASANPLSDANYVSFGDSYAANPGTTDSVISMGGCPNSASNYAAIVGQMTGMNVRSFSCNGALAYTPVQGKTIRSQIDHAIETKALDDKTKLVTISAGANDAAWNSLVPVQVQDDNFISTMTDNINLIRQHAPHAQVQIVGYPQFASAVDAMTCPANLNGFVARIPMPALRDGEQNLQRRQEALAEKTGSTFVDMKETSNIELAMCGKDGERHVSAVFDSDTQNYNMNIHPTKVGSRILAEQVVASMPH